MKFAATTWKPGTKHSACRPCMTSTLVCLLAAGALLAGCRKGSDAAPALTQEAAVTRAQAALGPFKKSIKGALVKGLAEGPGPAVQACRDEAPKIAVAASVDGVAVGRTSERLRSPTR